ncbi:MAG TPA: hypothetical protein VMR34_05725 [Candidatus Saccharimonadales bacterium]|nr:hypothetical protein [Candidatus Saccharimonadales bacterium]
MAVSKKDEKKVVDKVFGSLSIVAALILLALGVVCWGVGKNVVTTVDSNLASQKVYFPRAGTPTFSASVYPAAQQYAGQLVNNGTLAKAYANNYLGPQINLVGGGKTLSEITAEAVAAPQNVPLQELQGIMFQLNTAQTEMLSSGYADWSAGTAVKDIGAVALVAGVVLLVIAGGQFMMYKRLK